MGEMLDRVWETGVSDKEAKAHRMSTQDREMQR